MASSTIEATFIDPDSMMPEHRLLLGVFANGRRVSMREAREAHKRGERIDTRILERPAIALRQG